ncbi:MAG: hypothetical protein LBI67_05125 [Treponema sp.]|jgi:transcription elongation factor Elf1|nr:hypothetical protein [Treponema sp.]
MEVKCPNCFKIFSPNKTDETFLLTAIKKGQKLAMIECTECYKTVPINPLNLLEIEIKSSDKIMDCPICKEGIIVHIKMKQKIFTVVVNVAIYGKI